MNQQLFSADSESSTIDIVKLSYTDFFQIILSWVSIDIVSELILHYVDKFLQIASVDLIKFIRIWDDCEMMRLSATVVNLQISHNNLLTLMLLFQILVKHCQSLLIDLILLNNTLELVDLSVQL